jgi:hypothetical protein
METFKEPFVRTAKEKQWFRRFLEDVLKESKK